MYKIKFKLILNDGATIYKMVRYYDVPDETYFEKK